MLDPNNPDNPPPPDPSNPPPDATQQRRAAIDAAYMKYLGHKPFKESDYAAWMGNNNFEAEIAASPEAAMYKQTGLPQNPNGTTPPFNMGPGTTPPPPGTPGVTTPGTQPKGGNLKDPAYVDALIAWWAKQPGANPSLTNDPGYWRQQILSGHLGTDENFITGRFTQPEGAPAGGGGLPGGFGTLGGLLAPFTESFNPGDTSWQMPDLPQFDFSYPDFQFDQFKAPTQEEVLSDPGYAFRKGQGEGAITNTAAAQGLLRTGGTLKDFINYNQNFAANEYGNAFNRGLASWQNNEKGSFDTWNANRGKAWDTATAAFAPKMVGYTTEAAARQRNSEVSWEQAMKAYLTRYDIFKRNEEWPTNTLLDFSKLGVAAA